MNECYKTIRRNHLARLRDSAEVLDQESNWMKRRLKEALHIRAASDTMNLDTGLQLNPIWRTHLTQHYIISHYIITNHNYIKYVHFSFVSVSWLHSCS